MDLHSRSHRICLIHPDIHDLATDGPDTPYWSAHNLSTETSSLLVGRIIR
jgi:hypothetical protein